MKQIYCLEIENFLSLRAVALNLTRLNVLVGANGAGKTNILKVLQFLGEVARVELVPAVRSLGGIEQLIFRGKNRSSKYISIRIQGTITQHSSHRAQDEYDLKFRHLGPVHIPPIAGPLHEAPLRDAFYRTEQLRFKRTQGRGRRITLTGGKVTVAEDSRERASVRSAALQIEKEATGLGTLRRLSARYGAQEWNSFAEVVEQLRLFDVDVERIRNFRAVPTSDQLQSNAANLASFLQWMAEKHPDRFEALCDDVRYVLPSFSGFVFTSLGGSDSGVRLDVAERHLEGATPLARTSFGTIRAIALFAMLHDPNPPSLTCLEEIDHGLHPHALDRIVQRLRDASTRTQIILATHSPSLVNRLAVEELIVVEKDAGTGETHAFRPDADLVAALQRETEYGLGELWFSGALGGGLEA